MFIPLIRTKFKTYPRIIIIMSIFFILSASFVFAEIEKNEPFKVVDIIYNGKNILLRNNPVIVNDDIYVPASDFFKFIGAYYEEKDESKIIAYKSNKFFKVELTDNHVHTNGKLYSVENPTMRIDNINYIPLSIASKTFGLSYEYDEDKRRIVITPLKKNYKFAKIKDSSYKNVFIDDLGITVSIPYYWEKLDQDKEIYGYESDLDSRGIKFSKKSYSGSPNLDVLVDLGIKEIVAQKKFLLDQTILTDTPIPSYAVSGLYIEDETEVKRIYYLFPYENSIYTMEFSFDMLFEDNQIQDILDKISSSLQINQLTVVLSSEHYIEFQPYFDYDIHLNAEIYSNILSSDFINFSGTYDPSSDLEKLDILVTKGNDKVAFSIPVKDGVFDGDLYLPFGLGKHNITIMAHTPSSEDFSYTDIDSVQVNPRIDANNGVLLQFSGINISLMDTRYLIHSNRVYAKSVEISSLANLWTYKETSKRGKIKGIYKWISGNINFDDTSYDYRNNAIEVFDNSNGNEEEINYFYTSLLRSINIPARVVSGTSEDKLHYWVEIEINGSWVASEVVHQILEDPKGFDYIILALDEHYSYYNDIKILPY